MNAKTIFSSLAVASVAGLCLYNYHPGFRTEVNNILGIQEQDTVLTEISRDTLYYEESKEFGYDTANTRNVVKKIPQDKYAALDFYAKNTPISHEKDIATLAKYLLIPAKTEEDKARLAFSWIAMHVKYDAPGFSSGNYGDCSAPGVLKRRAAVCEGYVELFKELSIAMGLKVEKLTGYAKGFGFLAGNTFNESNHAWNVVQIEGKWKLMDVTWGSGYVTKTKSKLVAITEFDPYWFNVAPTEFIFSHFPEDSKWQMAGTKISLSQYEKMPAPETRFFNLGFNSKVILSEALAGKFSAFVESYDNKIPVKVVQMPFTKYLNRGEKCKFIVQSDYVQEMTLIDDNEWIKLVKNENEFSAEYAPKGKSLMVAALIKKGSNWSTILTYEIRNKTALK